MTPPDNEPFALRGRQTLEKFFADESDKAARIAALEFVVALQTDPRGNPGTPLPGSTLNEVCRILVNHDIAVTWSVVWGERVIWLHHIERIPAIS